MVSIQSKTAILLGILLILSSCEKGQEASSTTVKEGMIKVAILYPTEEGGTFDMDYYATRHMPLVARLFGESLKLYEIEKGISGRTPDDPIPYVAIGYLYFDDLAAYQNAFGPNADEIRSDIPNYTNIVPIIQISKVIK